MALCEADFIGLAGWIAGYLGLPPEQYDDCEAIKQAIRRIVPKERTVAALKLAQPIVERAANAAPTEPQRRKRQQEAAALVAEIKSLLNREAA